MSFNKAALIKLTNDINKKTGTNTMYTINNANRVIPRFSTGISDLDSITGGGLPKGRVIEVFGPPSAGKTTLLYHLYGLQEMSVHYPVEGSMDSDRAAMFGATEDNLIIGETESGEECMNRTISYARTGVPIIGIDSVPSLVPKDDLEKMEKAEKRNSVENQRMAGIARLLNTYLVPLEEVIKRTGTTVIFVNQVRAKMDAMLFGEKTQTPGGYKLEHSASIRIKVARRQWLDCKNYNPHSSSDKEKIGMIMKLVVVKSKVCHPMGECEIPLIFDKGFVSFDNLKEEIVECSERRKEFYSSKPTADDEWEDYTEEETLDNWEEEEYNEEEEKEWSDE